MDLDTEKYLTNTLSYTYTDAQKTDDQLENVSFSKFTLNNQDESSLVSKSLDRLTQVYYLYVRALDIYGKYHYLEIKLDRLENAEVGWALADDQNEDNDWYQYLDTSGSNTVATVNAPKLADGMEAVKYVGEENTPSSALEILTSGSRWANAVTKDGSMWVWIPRYAYRISSGYHQSGADINPDTPTLGAGTIEIAFVDTENHFLDKSLRGQTILTGGVTDETYTASNVWILEPGFEFGDEHLSGFWCAKFQASNTEQRAEDNVGLNLQIKPNARIWKGVSSVNMFSISQGLKSSNNYNKYFNSSANVDTHMTKNIEWGACCYLAHSKYGLNGQAICKNSYGGLITGIGSDSPGAAVVNNESYTISNQYNTSIGINASTTKNVYGIYDMNGGAFEFVAGCYTGKTSMLTDSVDVNYINKYIDIYTEYSITKYGDAIYETSSRTGTVNSFSWLDNFSRFVDDSNPLFVRGGYYGNTSFGGCFYYSVVRADGYTGAYNVNSFRPTIAITDDSNKNTVPNMPEGWAVAKSNNTANDWYSYKDTSSVSGAVAEVNAPKLASGMTPIKYVGEEDTTSSDLETLTSGSRWANAMTKDGSMWVWIPRYAYRIASGYHTKTAGNIEIAFLDSENNFLDSNITGTVVTGDVSNQTYSDTSKWILEPAFEFGGQSLDGFWFAKFEASNNYWYGDNSATADRTALTLQVKPDVTSWRNITAKNMFTVSQELISNTNYEKYFNNVTNIDTHMTKNVEWGAATYLAHSKYGLNGQEIYINNNNGYITGISGVSPTASSSSDFSNKYNTTVGINASTTKNIYGIYDMSGGATESVAACNFGQADELTSNTNLDYINKYIDRYTVYSNSKYGDAVYETSSLSLNTNSWFDDASDIVNLVKPIFMRGGDYQSTTSAGLFHYKEGTDSANNSISFRPTCIVY